MENLHALEVLEGDDTLKFQQSKIGFAQTEGRDFNGAT